MLFTKVNIKKRPLAPALIFLTILIQIVASFKSVSASVSLVYFHAIPGPDYVKLEWETAQELDNLGFNIYRGLTNNVSTAQKINSSLIPGNNSTTGSYYEWIDNNVQVGTLYYYWLEDIDIYGAATKHGPENATPGNGGTIPTVPSGGGNNSTSTPTPTRTPTATPSPTSQSGTTATPSNTPTRTPTSEPTSSTSNSNPTATTPAQAQATAVSNNAAATSAPQNSATATLEVVVQEESLNDEQPAALPESAGNTVDTNGEESTSSIALSQSGTETESEGNNLGNAIGQNATTSEGSVTSGDGAAGNSNRSTIILMALIASVIFLIAGGGGIAVLILNRNKQSRT